MHPEWQQKLVPLVKMHFPNLQVIATTHSPLIVANAEPGEVVLLWRDAETRQVQVQRFEGSFQGWRADQIPTGPVFGLQNTMGHQAVELIDEYASLLENRGRSPEYDRRIQQMERKLDDTIPDYVPTETARAELADLGHQLLEHLMTLPEDQRGAILKDTDEVVAQFRAEDSASEKR
jgi:predicted ATP-binding protein involved in virulence